MNLNNPRKMILTAGPSITALEKKYVNDAVSNGWNRNWNNYLSKLEREFKSKHQQKIDQTEWFRKLGSQ